MEPTRPGAPTAAASIIQERYRIERELGAGGMATVYLAADLRHGRRVAIKVLKPELGAALGAKRFLREIEILSQLQHPHILPLHDSGEIEGSLFYVMPYVDGESLRQRIAREHQLPLDDALRITREVADALTYAHERGVVHRDIKPENILLASGHAIVADFGIARAVTTAGGARLTDTGLAIGTPAYMSPEQALGETTISGRSDVYSLACVLYEMLAGDPPFAGTSPLSVLARKSIDAVPSLRTVRATVPAAVEHAIMRALARTPADRFGTAQEFVDALCAPDLPRMEDGKRTRVRLRSWGWRTKLGAAALAVTAVGAAVLARRYSSLSRGGGTPVPPIQRQVTFLGNVRSAAISPDSRSILYADYEEGPFSNVFVRDLDRGEPLLIARVELLHGMAWSPDGATLLVSGILGDSTYGIYIFPRMGGAPRRLVRAAEPAIVTWSPDGRRIGAAWRNSGRITITEVATGSTTTIDSGYKLAVGMAWSRLDRLAVGVSETPEIAMVHILDIATRRKRPAFVDSTSGALGWMAWTSDGRGLYYAGWRPGLRRIWFSPAGTPIAPPELLLSDRFLYFTLTADGQRMLYVRQNLHTNLRALTLGTGPTADSRELTTGTAAYYGPALSPDGRWVIVGRGAYLFRVPFEGGAPSQVTFSDTARSEPVWSPDGSRVAFGMRNKEGRSGIGIVESTGGPVRFIPTAVQSPGDELAWAPGSTIVASAQDLQNFYIVDPSTAQSRKLLNDPIHLGQVYRPRVSPDGQRLAFVRWEDDPKPEEAWVVSLADGARLATIPFTGGHDLVGWTADGTALLAVTPRSDTLMRVSLPDGKMTKLARLGSGCTGWTVTPMVRARMICTVQTAFSDAWLIENFGAVTGARR